MEYVVHVYVLDQDVQDYVGDIIARQRETNAEIEHRILIDLLRGNDGVGMSFEMTEVREEGKRTSYEVDFSNPNELFTDAIKRAEDDRAARMVEYRDFDLIIEMRDLNNNANEANNNNGVLNYNYPPETPAPAAGGSHKKRHGGKRVTKRKSSKRKASKRKASKTRRYRK